MSEQQLMYSKEQFKQMLKVSASLFAAALMLENIELQKRMKRIVDLGLIKRTDYVGMFEFCVAVDILLGKDTPEELKLLKEIKNGR